MCWAGLMPMRDSLKEGKRRNNISQNRADNERDKTEDADKIARRGSDLY